MKTNKLQENMRRFGTKNLNKLTEQEIKLDPTVKAYDDVLKQQGFTYYLFDHPWDVYEYRNSAGLLTLICLINFYESRKLKDKGLDAVIKIIPQTDLSQREIDPNKFRQYMDHGTYNGDYNKVFDMEHQAIEFTIPSDDYLINKKAKLKRELQKMIAKYGKANKL
jgi:hypothetical protein